MATPTSIPFAAVPPTLHQPVVEAYKRYLLREDRLLTYEEAAWLYGYKQNTLRILVCTGRLRAVKPRRTKRSAVYLRHADIRTYIMTKKTEGSPRKAMRNAQKLLA